MILDATEGAAMEAQPADIKRRYEYELGHTDRELRRLATQAALVEPFTRSYFQRAGVGQGMRVLDVGSGAGDVAFLVAGLVGPAGEVVGTDRSPMAVAAATARAKAQLLSNVGFVEGDPAKLTFDMPFDAIVGRYVLMFSPDPVAMLRGIAKHLRPGGVIVFHEVDWTGAGSFPPAPTYDRCFRCILETFHKVGTNPYMGLGLHAAFIKAGLPAPTMAVSALAGWRLRQIERHRPHCRSRRDHGTGYGADRSYQCIGPPTRKPAGSDTR
jgi:SAM-dependent methyltransferase